MANFFNQAPRQQFSPREKLYSNYHTSRINLLLAAVFTLINVLLILMGKATYFLFSACVPYIVALCGAIFCGALPQEYYDEIDGYYQIFESSVIYVFAAIALVMIALYVICFLFSKKRVGFLIIALVFFSLDTAFMFFWYGLDLTMLMDILFHGWVLGSLIVGVRSYFKLKKIPEEVIVAEATEKNEEETASEYEDIAEETSSEEEN